MKKTFLLLLSLMLVGCQNADKEIGMQGPKPHQEKRNVVKVTEFFDFGCSHCKKESEIIKNIKEKFKNKIQIVLNEHYLSAEINSGSENSKPTSFCITLG